MVRPHAADHSALPGVRQGEHAAGEAELVGHLQHAVAVLAHADYYVHQFFVRLGAFKLSCVCVGGVRYLCCIVR